MLEAEETSYLYPKLIPFQTATFSEDHEYWQNINKSQCNTERNYLVQIAISLRTWSVMSLHLCTRNNSVGVNGTAFNRWNMETSQTSRQWFYYVLRQHLKPALLFRRCGLWDPLRLLSIEKLQKWTRRNPLPPCYNSLSYDKTHISSASVETKESSISLEERRHINTWRQCKTFGF